MIFSLQCIGESGYGNNFSFRYGSRGTFGSCWNTYLASTDFVETYEDADGRPFDWDNYIPGFNSMDVAKRAVYFLRDGMTDEEKICCSWGNGRHAYFYTKCPCGRACGYAVQKHAFRAVGRGRADGGGCPRVSVSG